jgi:hypothetical protein
MDYAWPRLSAYGLPWAAWAGGWDLGALGHEEHSGGLPKPDKGHSIRPGREAHRGAIEPKHRSTVTL